MTKLKRALVTGGAGFIGSHLCEKLIKLNYKVYCLDNLYSGSLSNISSLRKEQNFEFINHDVCFPIKLEVNEIFNFACPASPKFYQMDPVKTIKTAIQGAINMLDLAEDNGAKILQASTSEIYGDPKEHPQTEKYWGNVNPIGPRSCYDEGKRAAETLFFDYKRQKNVKIKVVRIFNTYGPNMLSHDGRVVSNLIIQTLENNPITIYGDGKQTRCFCYIDDMIRALISMMNSNINFIGPINLGNPHEISILNLAKVIKQKVNSNSKILFKNLPIDDPIKRKPSIDLANKKLNWFPVIKLDEGLDKTIDFFKNKNQVKV